MANRLYNWRIALKSFPEFPFLGVGFGARQRAFYDNHFVLVLSEVGLIGLAAFLYMLLAIFRQTLRIFREEKGIYFKALALGMLAGFIGIVIQSAASVAFIITRIAGPFWFLLGMIVASSGKGMNFWAQHKEL
jgi:O-antigen ligase